MLMFFGGGFWQALGDRFLQILIDFEVPWGVPFGSKMGSENEVRKKSEKGWFGEMRLRPPGSP